MLDNQFLLLTKKHTDTHFEKTKTEPQETPEFKLKKKMKTFSFNPPINLPEEGKWLLARTSFDGTNFVFEITDEDNSFSVSTPSYWTPEDGEELIIELKKLLELASANDIKLNVKEVEKKKFE